MPFLHLKFLHRLQPDSWSLLKYMLIFECHHSYRSPFYILYIGNGLLPALEKLNLFMFEINLNFQPVLSFPNALIGNLKIKNTKMSSPNVFIGDPE